MDKQATQVHLNDLLRQLQEADPIIYKEVLAKAIDEADGYLAAAKFVQLEGEYHGF